jgi:hypothetical protein
MMHIKDALHVARGVLEGACVWNYDDTIPNSVKGGNYTSKKSCVKHYFTFLLN